MAAERFLSAQNAAFVRLPFVRSESGREVQAQATFYTRDDGQGVLIAQLLVDGHIVNANAIVLDLEAPRAP
jgi:hypothetical protein